MITHNWNVDQVECLPNLNGFENIITRVGWTLTTTDGKDTVTSSRVTDISVSPGATFTNFNELTEKLILSWVHDELGLNGTKIYEEENERELSTLSLPKLVSPNLPWKQVGEV